MIFGTV